MKTTAKSLVFKPEFRSKVYKDKTKVIKRKEKHKGTKNDFIL